MQQIPSQLSWLSLLLKSCSLTLPKVAQALEKSNAGGITYRRALA